MESRIASSIKLQEWKSKNPIPVLGTETICPVCNKTLEEFGYQFPSGHRCTYNQMKNPPYNPGTYNLPPTELLCPECKTVLYTLYHMW